MPELAGVDDTEVIIRSSGLHEGMDQRGQYLSEVGRIGEIQHTLHKVLLGLYTNEKTRDNDVALIVQRYVKPHAHGHLSNERRCYEERRDWLGETEALPSFRAHQFVINIREWRDQRRGDAVSETVGKLECHQRVMLPKEMRPLAKFFYTQQKARFHLEWVWDGEHIYVVQADQAVERFGRDPTEIRKHAKTPQTAPDLKVLKLLDNEHAEHYSKVKNVYVYRSLGLATTSLYLLNDPQVLRDLADRKVSGDLRSDLATLLSAPLVIRTDVRETEQAKKQFLKRSDELRTVEMAVKWLCDAAHELVENDTLASHPVFIFHNFLPAISSAFVYAAPNQRLVQITGLWGLPEGLYYNSHDQFLVDTINAKKLDTRSESIAKFNIQRRLHYKRFFVCPDEMGRWTRQIVASPHDWRSSIWKDDWLRQMASASRRIADAEGKALSIMWFVGVQGRVTPDGIMPWFHEPFDTKLFEKSTISARKKNIWETSFQVSTEADIRELENLSQSEERGQLKRIEVNPMEDALLRNRRALERVGSLAESMGAIIVLEGAVLSHAYYQLVATGATVEVVHPFIEFQEKQEFNKLVRDKIPEIIRAGGERVLLGRLDRGTLLEALRDKLVEEAVETKDAQDVDQIMEELADVDEVLFSILELVGKSRDDLERLRLKKREKRGGFAEGLVLLETNQEIPSEPIKADTEWLDGLGDADEKLRSVGGHLYASLSNHIGHWQDVRDANTWREGLLTLEAPLLRDSWHFKSKRLKSNSGNWLVEGELKGVRKKSRIRIELSVKLSQGDLELFDQARITPPPSIESDKR